MSAVTVVLKKAVLAVRKSCDSYHEKAVPAVRKSCLLCAEANEVRWVISDYWNGHSAFIGWIWLKKSKISLKGILLFWV